MRPEEIRSYYEESFEFLNPRKARQVKQLVLLNNLQRGDQNIASTLLVTLFLRVLSALYDDKMQVKFLPSQGINQDQINAYNTLARSDYLEMNKARLDYDWVFDTLFFGKGYCETLRFNKKRKIMEPAVINPLVFGYDPYFEDPQEWRYYWKWLTKGKWEIKKLIKQGVITGIKDVAELPTGIDPYLWDYKVQRDKAKKATTPSPEASAGDVYQILEFYGYDDKGEKCVFWTDRDISIILLKQKLDLQDGEQLIAPNGKIVETGSKWPIVVKEAYREPHSSVVFSVADLLEDKHRAKSVLLNLAYVAAKDKANPLYWYDPDKVKDVAQFFSRQINQHIPVEGDGSLAVGPINKEDPMSTGLLNFISMLTDEANEPVGTGVAMQPQSQKTSDTATEAAIQQQLNDMAQSLQSKVMQFGEAEFWSHWFHRYARYADELGDKMANIVGVKGVDSQKIDLKNFNTDFPPGVFVYSAREAEYKELVKRRDYITLYPQLAQTLSPEGLRNFNKHIFFPAFLDDPSLIEVMFPQTIDEIKAAEENQKIQKNELPQVADTDEHETHIYMHRMVQENVWAKWFHIAEHEDKLAEQKLNSIMNMQGIPGMMGTEQPPTPNQMPGKAPITKEQRSPIAAASPLKTATKQSLARNQQVGKNQNNQ